MAPSSSRQIRSGSNCTETEAYIESVYAYERSVVSAKPDGSLDARVEKIPMRIRTDKRVPCRLGVMIVGLGGNNGSSLVAMQLANAKSTEWRTKNGVQRANYYGSLTQASTLYVGYNAETSEPVYAPFQSFIPMVCPDNLVFAGWDISGANLMEATRRARVFDPEMLDDVRDELKAIKPMPALFNVDFVNANQEDRCDNVMEVEGGKMGMVDQIRSDIRKFKQEKELDRVIVVWMANTERFCDVRAGLNLNEDELVASVRNNEKEVSPSTLYGMAAIMENCPYINGSPQNTFVPGLVEMATRLNIPIIGDDLKTGQTKLKSVLVDFLVSAGMKPLSIVSYNHLGNNDGLNLSAVEQFRSKESNQILFPRSPKSPIDHCIVIKYIPAVGDSKRAMDEYYSEIGCGGRHTLVIHNTCEDSILAAPIILDLILLTELFSRMNFSLDDGSSWSSMHPVFSVLSYLCKAPLVPNGSPVVNAMFSQRACIENLIRASIGLNPVNHMGLEFKIREMPAKKENGIHHDNVANGNI